jgi:hypothetical protein
MVATPPPSVSELRCTANMLAALWQRMAAVCGHRFVRVGRQSGMIVHEGSAVVVVLQVSGFVIWTLLRLWPCDVVAGVDHQQLPQPQLGRTVW